MSGEEDVELPPGWEAFTDDETGNLFYVNEESNVTTWWQPVMDAESRDVYFFDPETGETSWTLPVDGEGEEEVGESGAIDQNDMTSSEIEGWKCQVDEITGRKFYYNEEDDISTWEFPAVFAEKLIEEAFNIEEDLRPRVPVLPPRYTNLLIDKSSLVSLKADMASYAERNFVLPKSKRRPKLLGKKSSVQTADELFCSPIKGQLLQSLHSPGDSFGGDFAAGLFTYLASRQGRCGMNEYSSSSEIGEFIKIFLSGRTLLERNEMYAQIIREMFLDVTKKFDGRVKAGSLTLSEPVAEVVRWCVLLLPPASTEIVELFKKAVTVCCSDLRFIRYVTMRVYAQGLRECIPTVDEMRYVSMWPRILPLWYTQLSEVLFWEEETFRSSEEQFPVLVNRVPHIMIRLARQLEHTNCFQQHGIFRLPGNSEEVKRLERDTTKCYFSSIENFSDTNVMASAWKRYLRSLAEPLVPTRMYGVGVKAAYSKELAASLVQNLPEPNKTAMEYVRKLLQRFLYPEVQAVTAMNADNIAIVFCPNLIRNPNQSPEEVQKRLTQERSFVSNLLLFDFVV